MTLPIIQLRMFHESDHRPWFTLELSVIDHTRLPTHLVPWGVTVGRVGRTIDTWGRAVRSRRLYRKECISSSTHPLPLPYPGLPVYTPKSCFNVGSWVAPENRPPPFPSRSTIHVSLSGSIPTVGLEFCTTPTKKSRRLGVWEMCEGLTSEDSTSRRPAPVIKCTLHRRIYLGTFHFPPYTGPWSRVEAPLLRGGQGCRIVTISSPNLVRTLRSDDPDQVSD